MPEFKSDETVHRDKLNSIEDILSTPPKAKISYHTWKLFKEELTEHF